MKKSSGAIKGWAAEVLRCVKDLPRTFELADVYKYENHLRRRYPNNKHVREKIRQQLQVLRDHGMIIFVDNRGQYTRK